MTINFTLKQLSYFVSAAEAGTTAAAAEQHFMSQSAMSGALSDLEKAMGLQLMIRRKGKGLDLTDAGRIVLADVRRLLTAAEELNASANELQQGLSGALVVGCFEVIAPQVMPRLLERFTQMYPEVQIDFIEGSQQQLHEALLGGMVELAILYEFGTPPGIIGEPLYSPKAHVLLPPGHRLAASAAVSLTELAEDPFIYLDAHPSHAFISDAFAAAGVTPNVRFRSKSFDHIRALVQRGMGYTLLAQRAGSHHDRWGSSLIAVPISDAVPAQPIIIARAQGVRITRRAAAFRDLCLVADRNKLFL